VSHIPAGELTLLARISDTVDKIAASSVAAAKRDSALRQITILLRQADERVQAAGEAVMCQLQH
jgi:hypothetical protein